MILKQLDPSPSRAIRNSFPAAKLEENSESLEDQIMSVDKYPSMFLKSNGAIVVIIFKYLPPNLEFENWEISLELIRSIFSHVTRSDKLRATEIFD